MSNEIDRRRLLKAIGASALATATSPLLASQNPHAANGLSEKNQSGMPRLLPGCCAYSYRELLTTGQMTLEDFILKAAELRLLAIDMTVYYLKTLDPKYLSSLRNLAYKNAVTISGVACRSFMAQADPAKRAAVLLDIKKWIDVTEQLGAPHLRVHTGPLEPGVTMSQAVDSVVEVMKAALEYSSPKGIMLGIEAHPGVSQTAPVCLELMRRIDSPYAGIVIDITHFVPTPTQDAYAQIAACIPHATYIHVRNLFDDRTPIDMDRVWRLFANAGYRGYFCAEYESDYSTDKNPRTGVPKLIAEIQGLCKKYSSV